MEIGALLQNYRRWPGATWVKAILAGLVVGLFLKAIGFWSIIGLIGGLAAFVATVWWLHRHDPLLDGDDVSFATASRAAAGGVPMGAPAARFYDAPPPDAASRAGASTDAPPAASATPAQAGAARAPQAAPPARSRDAAPTAETAGESQRVRDAARAAGEAARMMAAPAAADAGRAAASAAEAEARKPETLGAPRAGAADDLKKIKGVGPKLESTLHALGVYHFDQIAGWGPKEIAWIDANLEGFPGRATRDDWVGQAKLLSSGGETEFSRRVEDGDVYDD